MKSKSDFSCQSPVQVDYDRVVNYDEEGNELISYEEVDYPKIQAALGSWSNWSLEALLKAGVDPAFPIHTGSMNTRLEGIDDLNQMVLDVDAMLNENKE